MSPLSFDQILSLSIEIKFELVRLRLQLWDERQVVVHGRQTGTILMSTNSVVGICIIRNVHA
jgi:hypothetical protein